MFSNGKDVKVTDKTVYLLSIYYLKKLHINGYVCLCNTHIYLPKYPHVHIQTYAHMFHFVFAELKLRFVSLSMLTKGSCSIIGNT